MVQQDKEKYDPGPEGPIGKVIELVGEAQRGSRRAFDGLVEIFHEEIFRMVFYRTRSEMDAEDLTQDIFIKAHRNLAKLKNPGCFRGWLFSISINCVRDFYRKKKVKRFFEFSSQRDMVDDVQEKPRGDVDIVEKLAKKDFWKYLEVILQKLSRLEREVFLLRFLDSLSIKEISETLKRGESTVKTHLYRAIKKIRQEPNLLKILEEEI
jgi:RNA polymerase sigma-70 factor (ECF subfamily)